MAFDERVLLDQDRMLSAVLAGPEFQKKMTQAGAQQRCARVLATCHRLAVPCLSARPPMAASS